VGNFLLPLRAEGTKAPLFIVPGEWGGENEMLIFYSMLPLLDKDRPIYAVFSRALDQTWELPLTLKDQAAAVLEVMQRVKPHGPYLILGECLASTLAMEIARQAEKRGASPGSVILLDAAAPEPLSLLTHWMRRLGSHRAGWKYNKFKMLTGDPVPPRMAHYFELLMNWEPSPVRSSLHLLYSSTFPERQTISKRWRRFAKGSVKVHQVRGDHHSYLREDLAETATLLNHILRATESASGIV
jgi:thioesterase domain-containing protein